MENLELAYAITNQYLFQEAKNNITDLSYYFSINPSTSGNMLIEQLVDAVKTYDLASMDLPLFQAILNRSGKTGAEANKILGDICKWKSYSKEQIEPARKYLQDVCANIILQKANNLHQDHPSDILKYLKNFDFKTTDLEVFSPKKFGEIDVNSLIADEDDDFIPSRYEWINQSFSPYPGYQRGQMCLITAPPGVGKSLFAMSEASFMAGQGYKVLYIALGDLKPKDFIVRMGAMYSGMSFANTHKSLGEIYKLMSNVMGENLEISISPAGKVSADDIVDYVKNSKTVYDVIYIDYDGNLKGANASESMYANYGTIYEKLNELVLMGKLLFICSQPKIGVWSNPVLELQDIGESSKKQQTADFIIAIGREVDSPNHLHTMKIVKSRRGEEGLKCYTIRLNNGRFIDLGCKGLYDQLKAVQEKRDYTDADINGMISQFQYNIGQIRQSLNAVTANNGMVQSTQPQQPTGPLGNTPFNNKP